ncbi:alpha mannosidase-like protein [Actinomortierella ambigua]|uniref:alpha-1,2-Mannosidase n=1 Tax=Actinomortierella ambigua TaxID=1343610 RepID=A0A9P6U9D2_9FUNG|nr:alpha mannosidase-like protein [Actinomortierella ambigua]
MPEDQMPLQPPWAVDTPPSDQAVELSSPPSPTIDLEPEEPAPSAESTAPSFPAINPWLMVIFYVCIQLLVSPYWPSAGVHADESSQSSYSNQYHRPLSPILNASQSAGTIVSTPMTTARRLALRAESKQMFLEGYQAYLDHAFPLDELNPLACSGRGPDKKNNNNLNINDVLGDFSLTLVDALDTLATLREPALFREAIDRVVTYVRFDVDNRVQVFEVNIRVLGALLSAHLYATDPRLQATTTTTTTTPWLMPGEYNGELLTLASDLGRRLLRAFEGTATGIPWPRVNLKRGVMSDERTETCAAGAGSLLLEFGVLSRLTGDPSFEDAAKNALHQLWTRRTELGLVGNTIDIQTGQWQSAIAGIGAGTDSFYEYLIKSYILFGDAEYLEMYESAATAIQQQLLHETGYFYKHIHITEGRLMATWVDSLSAFLPGVQVLAGDLESAIKNHLYFFNIWRKYQAIPERFDFIHQDVSIANYPLRPEFVESTYLLYRATKDPFYMEVGEMILHDLKRYTKTKCGWASLASVTTKKQEDRMESFALSETFKYLFLLFDEENVLHHEMKDTNFVFTTEGHVLYLRNEYLDSDRLSLKKTHQPKSSPSSSSASSASSFASRRANEDKDDEDVSSTDNLQTGHPSQRRRRQRHSPAQPMCLKPRLPDTFLKGTAYRPDFDFARQLVGVAPDVRDRVVLDPAGYCDKPQLDVEQVTVMFQEPAGKTFYDLTEEEEEEEEEETVAGIRKAREYHRQMRGRTAPPVQVQMLDGDHDSEDQGSNSGGAAASEVGGVYIDRLVGVKLRLVHDPADKGYRANMVDGHVVHPMEPIYVDLTAMQPLYDSFQRQKEAHLRIIRPLRKLNGGDSHDDDNEHDGDQHEAQVEVEETKFPIMPALFGTWRPRLATYDPAVVKHHKVVNRPTSSFMSSSTTNDGEFAQDQELPFGDTINQHVMDDDHQRTAVASGAAADAQSEAQPLDTSGSSGPQKPKRRRKSASAVSSTTSEMARVLDNTRGCRPYRVQEQHQIRGKMVVVDQGSCLFILKAYYAQVAGASGVVVISSNDQLFQMVGNKDKKDTTADQEQQKQQNLQSGGNGNGGGMVIGESLDDDVIDIPVVMIGNRQGLQLVQWIHQDQNSRDTTSATTTTSPPHDNRSTAKIKGEKKEAGANCEHCANDTQPPRSRPRRQQRGLEAQLVQQRLSRETLLNARLSYNQLPILNIQTFTKFR